MHRLIPSQGLDTQAIYKGKASVMHCSPQRFVASNMWFGFGFSNKIYEIKTAAAIAAWGIRHVLGVDNEKNIRGEFLVVIPDALQRSNYRAQRLEPYVFKPMCEPLQDAQAEREIADLSYARREMLMKELTAIGYPPSYYEIKFASQLCEETGFGTSAESGKGGIGLDDIERMLFKLKNDNSSTHRLFYPQDGRIEDDGYEAENGKKTKDKKDPHLFSNDVIKITNSILENKMNEMLRELGDNHKARYDRSSWMGEYVVKQAALTLYMGFCYEPTYSIKIGPPMEKRFDGLTYSLLGNTYGDYNRIPTLFKEHKFGTVLVEPEMQTSECG